MSEYDFVNSNFAGEFSVPGVVGGKYQAAQASKLRPRPQARLRHEDYALPQGDRDRIQSALQDEQRNYAIAAWAIRMHLDFNSEFSYDFTSDDKTLDDDIEGIIAEASEPENFDVRGRSDRQDHIRTDEAMRTVAGDMLLERLGSGQVQAIEGDRIRNPPVREFGAQWRNGVFQDPFGRNTHYAIHRRTPGGFEFERIIAAEKVFHFGYFHNHDTSRGISRMTSGLDVFRQSNQTLRYAQAKQFLGTLFGLVHNKENPSDKPITLNGPFVAEIGPDDKLGFMGDTSPSKDHIDFFNTVVAIAIKCLDLPQNFYDSAHTNFFGSRASLNLYLISCLSKRRGVNRLLRGWTAWILNMAIATGRLRLPRSMDLQTLLRKYSYWIPVGVQWFNPLQEAKAAQLMLQMRLASRSELRRETRGDSWFSLQDKIDTEEIRVANQLFEGDGQESLIDEIVDRVVATIAGDGTLHLTEQVAA